MNGLECVPRTGEEGRKSSSVFEKWLRLSLAYVGEFIFTSISCISRGKWSRDFIH